MSGSVNNFDENQHLFNKFTKIDNFEPQLIDFLELFFSKTLTDITGWNVLDLACGTGNFGRRLLDKGVNSVIGYDLSQKMITQAAIESNHDSRLQYIVADLETLELPKESINLVHCQFGFHYISNLNKMMLHISNSLVPNGILIFVVPHPINMCNPQSSDTFPEINGESIYPVTRYFEEGPRHYKWLGCEVTKKHHTISSYVNGCIKNNLEIVEFIEWSDNDPKLRFFPFALIIIAKKKACEPNVLHQPVNGINFIEKSLFC